MTPISKLINSVYLFWAFQLNEGFCRVSLPRLCLCDPLRLAVLVATLGLVSASLGTIIPAVSTWTGTHLTVALMP